MWQFGIIMNALPGQFLGVNFTDMTICSTAIVYYPRHDCEASATAVHLRRYTADCLSPPLHPSALPLLSPLGVELGWSQTGVRVELGWRKPHFSPSWAVPFSSCKETTFMLRPRDRYSVTAQKKLCRRQIEFFYPKSVISRLINRDNRTQRTARTAHLGRSIPARCCLLIVLFSIIISNNDAITILLRCRIERPLSVARGKRCRSMAQGG